VVDHLTRPNPLLLGCETGRETVRLITLSVRQVPRLLLLACRSSRSMDLELLVLRQELVVLCRQVPHPRTRQVERLVLTVLRRLRPARERLSNLFAPDTFRRWHRELLRAKWRIPHGVVSRPRISLDTQVLVWRMSRENDRWGYKRIQGELKKIGIEISTTSIRRILAVKSRPGPSRETWRQFMRTQPSSIIACDLFTVESIRLKTLHVVFIDLRTRRALIGGVTEGPANLAWCTQIARNLSEAREDRSEAIRFLVHDRDKRFGATLDKVSRRRASRSSERHGELPRRTPMPNGGSALYGPSASIASWCWALVTSSGCFRPTSSITSRSGPTAVSDWDPPKVQGP